MSSFVKVVVSWLRERTGLAAGRPCCGKVWPCAILFAFCVQAVTGFFLWCYYSPSRQTAWESVYFLQSQVAGGWLLRAIHHYTAHLLLALLIIYIVQSILTRACRAPRELVFWALVGMALMALAAFLTGDLLAWDQQGYYATKTRTSFLTLLPWVGESLLRLAIGGPGPELGTLAVTRFFALHVGLFSGGFLLLLLVRGMLARRAGRAGFQPATGRAGCQPAGGGAGVGRIANPSYNARVAADWQSAPRAWPCAMACLAVMAVVLWLAFRDRGAPLLSPADPAETYSAARPEWFLLGVYEFSHWFSGESAIVPIFVVPGLVLCIVLAMPFLARWALGHAFNVAFTLALLAALAYLSYRSVRGDRSDEKYREAVVAEYRQAGRVFDLAEHEGIPPAGALSLLRNDPKTQGPKLFGQQCASCHDHWVGEPPAEARGRAAATRQDAASTIRGEKPSAPNLANFASREWLAGLLDPKQISGPRYFGNTKLRTGKMPQFVRDTLGDLDPGDKENLKKVIMALSAEALLPEQAELDRRDAQAIEEGRKLLVDPQGVFGCTNCHSFHGQGARGSAPILTGYGSPLWTAGIVRDPTDKQYYGRLNDRMPSFAPSPLADSPRNTLSLLQIRLLTDWLRGDWWEPSGAARR